MTVLPIAPAPGTHLVVGAGGVGSAVALVLADAGVDVVLASRSGRGPDDPRIARVRVDASSVDALLAVAPSAVVIYNCVNPEYTSWTTDWPPMAQAFLEYAERTGAVLATVSNLYGYGPVDVPMTEELPLAAEGEKARVRVRMWQDAKAANDSGRIRATEVRGSDYICPGEQSMLGDRVMPRILAGKNVQLIGDIDQPHYVDRAHRRRADHRDRSGRPARLGPGVARAEQPAALPARGGGRSRGSRGSPRRQGLSRPGRPALGARAVPAHDPRAQGDRLPARAPVPAGRLRRASDVRAGAHAVGGVLSGMVAQYRDGQAAAPDGVLLSAMRIEPCVWPGRPTGSTRRRLLPDVVGLPVIGGFDDHDGYTGVMLGAREAAHLEFTTHSAGRRPARRPDDLLVLYARRTVARRSTAPPRGRGG